MKRLVQIVSIGSACLMLLAAAALAKPASTYTTSSTLEVKKATIEGKISSPKAACLANRQVKGAWLAPGAHLLTEAAISTGSGKWVIDFEVTAGSKGRLSISIAPKSLGGGASCKGFEKAEVVAK